MWRIFPIIFQLSVKWQAWTDSFFKANRQIKIMSFPTGVNEYIILVGGELIVSNNRLSNDRTNRNEGYCMEFFSFSG